MQIRRWVNKHESNRLQELRKFGPAYCDLPTLMQNVNTLLRVLTLNIDSKNKEPIPTPFYILTALTASAYAYVFLVSSCWFVAQRCVPARDVICAVVNFSLAVSSEIGNTKFLYLYLRRDIIRKIVQESLNFDAANIPDSRFSRNVLKSMKKAKWRATVFWFLIMCNGTVYVSKPILTPGRHFMDDAFTIYGLEPMEKSPNYEVGYALVAGSVWFLCYVPASVTALLILIAGYVEAQMLALAQELLHLWPDAVHYYNSNNFSMLQRGTFVDASYKKRILNEFINKKLQDIIKKHATNVRLLQMLEEVFKGAIAMEFMLLILGLIAELLGGLENTYLEVPYAFVQVAMDCWTGQRVMDAGVEFEAAVYASNWEQFDVANMKTVLMMLGSAQKTLKLSAGGVTMLSFACLMSVVRSIYSAYTALRSTIK